MVTRLAFLSRPAEGAWHEVFFGSFAQSPLFMLFASTFIRRVASLSSRLVHILEVHGLMNYIMQHRGHSVSNHCLTYACANVLAMRSEQVDFDLGIWVIAAHQER